MKAKQLFTESELKAMERIPTTLSHRTEPHCCGCYTLYVEYIEAPDNYVAYQVWAVCNECGEASCVGRFYEEYKEPPDAS